MPVPQVRRDRAHNMAPTSTVGAIEAGGTKFVLALADRQGAILERALLPTRSASETLPAVVQWFAAASARHAPIGAFGIGSFGPIGITPERPDYATFAKTPKPGWTGASFARALAAFGAPISLTTDVNAAALGEWLEGAGAGCGSLAYTTIGTGIGTGVLRDGEILSGRSHYESGHLAAVRDPDRDPFPGCCPFHGDCLEGLASGSAIMARWGHDLSTADAGQRALIAGYIAQLAAGLALLHRPERLIFGGGVMKAPGLVETVRSLLRTRLAGYLPEWDKDLQSRIVLPGLGDDAGITGAIELGCRALADGG